MRIDIPPRRSPALPVTMADLAFLLILFLILTVDPRLGGAESVPEFQFSTRIPEDDTVGLHVSADGSVTIDGRRVPPDRLEAELEAVSSSATLIVYAGPKVDYSVVDRLLTSLRQIGRLSVVLATEKPP